MKNRLTFGPVPSRRLGISLGINNIPPKTCTYSCIYCQIGRGKSVPALPCELYNPDAVIADAQERLNCLRSCDEWPDYLTFVPDGEPTLDMHLGGEIQALLSNEIKIAVITNSSLLTLPAVRDALMHAHRVSVKIDPWAKSFQQAGSINGKRLTTGP